MFLDILNTPNTVIVQPTTVRLPYALIPGLDITSSAFQKAVAYVAKQQTPSASVSRSHKKVKLDHLPASHDQGMFFYLIFIPSFDSFLLDLSRGIIGNFDRDAVKRAQDLIADVVISELVAEDPSSQDAFQNSLRHQVVLACQSLRVSLIIIDKLMSMYNNSISSDPKKTN
jgi:hypothetical protein